MADIKVKVIDKTTLELLEDAKVGDTIDLSSVARLDLNFINELIDSELNKIYLERIKETKANFEKELETIKENLQIKANSDLKELESKKTIELEKVKNLKSTEISELNHIIEQNKIEIDTLKREHENAIKLAIAEQISKLKEQSNIQIQNLQNTIKDKEREISTAKEGLNNALELQKARLDLDFNKKLEAINEEKLELENEINDFKHEKLLRNVKEQGENLEKWCNEEFTNARLAGFENCDWYKDNDAVKDDLDFNDRKTKADYIFKMYADEEFEDTNLITSVCLEMKSRDPNSTTKNKNKDHYNKLDSDRKKKNCEYALLVSELEIEGDNDAPIRKIPGYEKMYMVRPQYMITFLSIIYSLSKQYRNIILDIKKNDEELKDITEINKEFEELKETYLDKPLGQLSTQISGMKDNADKIIEAAMKINNQIDKIVNETLIKIQEKIDKFTIKQKKIVKKVDKLNS